MLFNDLTHQKGPITALHVYIILNYLVYSSVIAWLALCSGAHHAAAGVLCWEKLDLQHQGFLGSGWQDWAHCLQEPKQKNLPLQ